MFKKLYNDFFAIRKSEKITDKVLMTRIFSSCGMIIACLLAMGISAYAYFSSSLSSSENKLVAANYSIDVSVKEDTKYNKLTGDTYKVPDGTHSLEFSFDAIGNASTGYCKIVVTDKDHNVKATLFTVQIDTTPDEVIYIKFTDLEEVETIKFVSCWGTSVASLEKGKTFGSDTEGTATVSLSSSDQTRDITTE